MIDLKPILNGTHDVRLRVGVCCICRAQEDLRFGVCFKCSEQVAGELVSDTPRTHRLWDSKNPSNTWFVRE